MSDLVRNPEDRFSLIAAHIMLVYVMRCEVGVLDCTQVFGIITNPSKFVCPRTVNRP